MQGELSNPGVVPRAIQDVFDIIEKTPGRDFLLRMSMMEIYNEVSYPQGLQLLQNSSFQGLMRQFVSPD